jgi:hypothetical protein
MPSFPLLSRLGAIPVFDNLFLCGVLFLHRRHTQELLPHQGLGILGRDPFPHQECRSGVILFTINEPRTKYYAYPLGTDMGQPFPKSFECNACPTIYVLFLKSANDVSSHAKSIRWPWPWFLPKPRLAAELFLATWCQSNSRPLFPRLSPTTETTLPGNLAFSRLDKVVE